MTAQNTCTLRVQLPNRKRQRSSKLKSMAAASFVFVLVASLTWNMPLVSAAASKQQIKVFMPFRDTSTARKQRKDLKTMGKAVSIITNTTKSQEEFLTTNACVDGAVERFRSFHKADQSHLAEELWKFCALLVHGGVYLDPESPILDRELQTLKPDTEAYSSLAILMDDFAPNAIHGALLMMREPNSKICKEMAQLLIDTPVDVLHASPMYIPRQLYGLIAQEIHIDSNPDYLPTLGPGTQNHWFLMKQSCAANPFRQLSFSEIQQSKPKSTGKGEERRVTYQCSPHSGFCCSIFANQTAILASRHPVLPLHTFAEQEIAKPYQFAQSNAKDKQLEDKILEDLPFIATIRERSIPFDSGKQKSKKAVPTFYERLLKEKCLPGNTCSKCLSDKKHGSTCAICMDVCPCYCRELCKNSVESKQERQLMVTKEMIVTPPLYARDPDRLVPRIVHQTWFEGLTKEKYPNMSRLTESYRTSGWEYRFYTDDSAGEVLSKHFPPEVKEAYDTLIPGAFKADLFRYCVLLIYGGVYSDVDTMVGPSLDAAVQNDVGFMVGLDEPGKKIQKRMCLWNGFLAVAPGHPFLAKVIEKVVNNIRRRYTSIDMARDHCPVGSEMPEMSIINSFSPLFVAGPCMLGSTINEVLGRDGQTQFVSGELQNSAADQNDNGQKVALMHGKESFVTGLDEEPHKRIPGRTIILNQNKWDMGAHRFTLLEQNLIVFSTDFPDSDDREKLDDYVHYSETRVKFMIYGIDGVYKDHARSNELVVATVNATNIAARRQ